MLHIITPIYRFDLLQKVYNSILSNEDIRWHISKSNKREDINFDFIEKDKRIILYNVDCEDNEIYKKRNVILNNINDGYFCMLDDDTIFHENMYIKYKECIERLYVGMVIGQQLNYKNKIRLLQNKPLYGRIDTGNVLSHTKCLSLCRWPETHRKGIEDKDFLFWKSVYNFYDSKCELINEPISYYNKLR